MLKKRFDTFLQVFYFTRDHDLRCFILLSEQANK